MDHHACNFLLFSSAAGGIFSLSLKSKLAVGLALTSRVKLNTPAGVLNPDLIVPVSFFPCSLEP
jgi:hypothetical protein